jgi:small GTP-binding protein
MGNCNKAEADTSSTTIQTQQQQAPKNVDYDYMCKLLLLGDSGVGKSALMMRFAEDAFKGTFISTVGIDFKMKTVNIGGKRVKIQIWDTAGQERFRTITKTYYRGAQGYVLVFDITAKDSFDHVKYWLGEIKKNGNDFVPKVLVGNKSDLEDKRMVSKDECQKFAEEKGIPFVEASAKDGNNVQELFITLTERFISSAQAQERSQDTPVQDSK